MFINCFCFHLFQECPVVQNLNAYVEHEHHHHEASFIQKLFTSLFPFGPGLNAILATSYISGPPNFLLALIPPNIDPSQLNTLVSFAVGGLLGDVFLHLLPQTFVGEGHGEEGGVKFVLVDEHRNTILGLAMFFGFLAFISLEKAMRIMGAGHDHDHSHAVKVTHNTHVEVHDHEEDEDEEDETAKVEKSTGADLSKNDSGLRNRMVDADITDSYTITETNEKEEPRAAIKLSAYLNLIADFTHNITDGLAISASFYISKNVGATTCLAVFFHEIPHEVGDFALLIQGGFTKRQAMYAQFVTAIGAYLGTFLGIAINHFATAGSSTEGVFEAGKATGIFGTNVQMADLTLPFTAGGFLYIATVGVIPEIIEADEHLPKFQQVKKSLVNLVAMFVGIGLMFLISWNE